LSNVLSRIDAAIDGLCPCGAPPRDGFAYCGDDCTPTHVSEDTDERMAGQLATPMRWRPDLVTAADDDSDLIEVDASRSGYSGRYNARVFNRAGRPGVLHLRLDDGHRFVGMDVEVGSDTVFSVEAVLAITDGWQRLERELADPRHAVPDVDPWRDVMAPGLNAVADRLRGEYGLPVTFDFGSPGPHLRLRGPRPHWATRLPRA
jgi:hypothetical protein